jgi:hypothetical protein
MSKAIKQLNQFIPGIKGISASNRQGLLHIAKLLEQEEKDRESQSRFALAFYAQRRRYEGSNGRPEKDDPYTPEGAPYMQDVHRDGGDLARTALRELNES